MTGPDVRVPFQDRGEAIRKLSGNQREATASSPGETIPIRLSSEGSNIPRSQQEIQYPVLPQLGTH